MEHCNPVGSPLPKWHLTSDHSPTNDAERHTTSLLPYCAIVGKSWKCMYLSTCTRPDIAYAVRELAWFMSNYRQRHFETAKHLLRYLQSTRSRGVIYGGIHDPHSHSHMKHIDLRIQNPSNLLTKPQIYTSKMARDDSSQHRPERSPVSRGRGGVLVVTTPSHLITLLVLPRYVLSCPRCVSELSTGSLLVRRGSPVCYLVAQKINPDKYLEWAFIKGLGSQMPTDLH
jgi:hypothetical protein